MLIKESGCQTRSRLTEKLTMCGKTRVHHTSYMPGMRPGTTRRKANIYASKYGMTNVFLKVFLSRKSSEVSSVVMKHNKNRPAKYIVLCGQTIFPLLIFVVAEKWKNMVWTCKATCKGSQGGRLAQCVS